MINDSRGGHGVLSNALPVGAFAGEWNRHHGKSSS